VVILISLVALGAGNFPYCKPDEGNRVFFRSAWSHVLTENYAVIAFPVFALDAIMSMYGHVVSQLLDVIKWREALYRWSVSE
jgi:hypothetical protein